MGEVLTVEHARAAGLGTSYADTAEGNAQLEERIIARERWLASRIGPLLGPVTATRINPHGGSRLWLMRPIAPGSLVVSLDGTDVDDADVFVTHTRELTRADGELWRGRLVYSYMPDDEYAVREALLSLPRLDLSESGMQSETISGSSYSYTRGDGKGSQQAREAIVAELLAPGATIGA